MQPRLLRLVVPLLGLTLICCFAAVYSFYPNQYYTVLRLIGIDPFRYPFLDWEYIPAGAKCWAQGIDVYLGNPCDVLSRPHGYSPLTLRATFFPLDRDFVVASGFVLISLFYISLYWILLPRRTWELIPFSLAATSTTTAFAVERGNIDVFLFLVMAVAAALSTGALSKRTLAYATITFAGLLKFYPLVALIIALRERIHILLAVSLSIFVTLASFAILYSDELAAMAKNIPRGPYNSDLFGAANLPVGLLVALGAPWGLAVLCVVCLMSILAIQVVRSIRSAGLKTAFDCLPGRDVSMLIMGAAIISGCFLTGQSIGYRGIYLILVIGGLISMHRAANDVPTRTTLLNAVVIAVLLMWEGFFRNQSGALSPNVQFLAWLARELLWWWLVGQLLGIIVIFCQSNLFNRIKSTTVRDMAVM